MSRRSRRDAERKKTIRAVVVIAASVLVLCFFLILGQMNRPQTDANGCPRDDRFAAQVAVLLDPSDALSSVQHRSALPQLLEALEEVPETAEVRVYAAASIGRDGDAGAELRVCVPPHPDSIGTLEGLSKNRVIAARQYEEQFIQPLRQRLGELLDAPSDTVSPIVEAIQAAAVDAFQPRNADIPRAFIVVSDMVQHSSDLSFFRDAPDFGPFAGRPDYATLRVDLSGVQVEVFLLARRGAAGRLQAGRMQEFWEDYFLDQGAGSRPSWVPIEG